MTTYHILNGDCLAEQLGRTKINQDFIVCRECLIEGEVYAENMANFWAIRAKFIADSYNVSTEAYFKKTVSEFEKLNTIPDNSEICLWFENDLFCQTNMWFVISILSNYPTLKIFRVFPIIENNEDTWKGFAISNPEKLEQAYASKVQFMPDDIKLGTDLWAAYQNGDFERLKYLSKTRSNSFQYLEEVCKANIDRFPLDKSLGRPDKLVNEIIHNSSTEFQVVFSEFSAKEGIYGFGDLQVKHIYDRQMRNR